MRTHNIPSCYKNQKDPYIMPPDLALSSTLTSSNYPCLELKVFEPLKFDYIFGGNLILAILAVKLKSAKMKSANI